MTNGKSHTLGFRTCGYREWTLQDAFQSISDVGYDGVEVCLEHPETRPEELTEQRARELAQMARDAGIEIASLSYHGDGEPEAQRAENQKRAIALARQFGANVLILNAANAQPGKEALQWSEFRRTLRVLLPIAQAEGVLIALEPEPGHFLHSSGDMMRLLEEIGHPSLRVNLDVGHAFLTDDDVTQTVHALGEAIVHTHIEGMAAGVHEHLVPGEGDLDLVRVREALQSVGYGGYYTVDLFNIADDPEAYARRSLAALRRMFG